MLRKPLHAGEKCRRLKIQGIKSSIKTQWQHYSDACKFPLKNISAKRLNTLLAVKYNFLFKFKNKIRKKI